MNPQSISVPHTHDSVTPARPHFSWFSKSRRHNKEEKTERSGSLSDVSRKSFEYPVGMTGMRAVI
jgi:hypothetical protein